VESFGDDLKTQDSSRQGGSHYIHTTHTNVGPEAARSVPRLANVLVALVCCLQAERERDHGDCNELMYMTRVREAVRESCCAVRERLWNDDTFEDALKLMIDTGASTHMTNSRNALIDGTVVACDVQVVGVGGTPIHITEKGSVFLSVGGRKMVLRDVLLSEHAHLGAGPVHEPQVLVGVRKFARDTGLGLSFPADGKSMHVFDGNMCIATAETADSALYVIHRRDLESGNETTFEKSSNISVVLSNPRGSNQKEKENFEATSVKVTLTAPCGPEEDTKSMLDNTARVYPATDQHRTRSDSREKASSSLKVTDQHRTRHECDAAVEEEKGQETGKPNGTHRYTSKQRKAYGKLIHARTHMGHSSNVMSALRKAYGDKLEEDNDPCDACMWAKARMNSRGKVSRRSAKRLGDRLHYDLFQGPSRSEEGFKYVLVVIDEFTSRSWTVGLKRKSDLYVALRGVIAEVETRMYGARVLGLATVGK
jgi:hypothetical protein